MPAFCSPSGRERRLLFQLSDMYEAINASSFGFRAEYVLGDHQYQFSIILLGQSKSS